MPKFSVVIPTCNRPDMLALCLEKLAPGAQTLDASHYEVIVTDDGNDDATRQLIATKFPFVKWTKGPQRGPAANRNNGARMALGKWLVFTDDDCLPDHQWLAFYAKAIKDHPDVRAFEGAILPDNCELLKKDMAECPVNETGGCFWSANIMIEKRQFDNVGGFNDKFKIAANEDQELYRRIGEKSTVRFVRSAFVLHPVRFIHLSQKCARLFNSEKSQIYLKYLQGLSPLENWFDGIKIHFLAALSNLKRKHLKRFTYNCFGIFVRVIVGPVYILETYSKH